MNTLFIVGTPIGNLEDITLRALRVLREVRLVAAEDTRKARVLFDKYQITTPVTSYFEGNERKKADAILAALQEGDVALISEAGMPGISDPGYPLICAALAQGVTVAPVPGPSAHTAALVASGLPSDQFLFLGFLPRGQRDRLAALEDVAFLKATLIAYEAPHRLPATLSALREVLGNRPVALCREMTKHYEEVWRGDLDGALEHTSAIPPRGEYTLVIGGASDVEVWDEARVRAALAERLSQGVSRSQAAREIAAVSGWKRRSVYALEDNH